MSNTGWRYAHTSKTIDVLLEDFTPAQLLQGLIDSSYLDEVEALAILDRGKAGAASDKKQFGLQKIQVSEELDLAQIEMGLGRRREALIHLERFLGRDWHGRLVS